MTRTPRRPSCRAPVGYRWRPIRATGFTLIELLIALSLVALITLLLFSGLRLGSRAWEAVERVAEQNAEQRIARGFLERTLRQVRSISVPFAEEERFVFAGGPQALELVAPLSERAGIPGLYLLRLALHADRDGPALVLTRWLLHPEVLAGGGEVPPWQPLTEEAEEGTDAAVGELGRDAAAGAYGTTVLATEVERFEIAYFGVADGEDEADWLDAWHDRLSLPQRIRIRLATRSQLWPDLVVRLPEGF